MGDSDLREFSSNPSSNTPSTSKVTARALSNTNTNKSATVTNESTPSMRMTPSPRGKIPAVIQFAYNKYYTESGKRHATCRTCRAKIAEVDKTTSNFITHLRNRHPTVLAEYENSRKNNGQERISDHFSVGSKFAATHARQRQINHSLIDMIVAASLPLSFCENVHFRRFMGVCEPKWDAISRSKIRTDIRKRVDLTSDKLKTLMRDAAYVSVTVDIWSDRTMRGFLGITAHTVSETNSTLCLQSHLLTCQRFKGSHTGQSIAESFEEVCEKYGIMDKLEYIVTDNASNMRRAFTVCFPTVEDATDQETQNEDTLDDPSLWEQLPIDEQAIVDEAFLKHGKAERARLQCFTHTLQLAVRDGIGQTKAIGGAMSKCSKLCTQLHSSCILKEAFEETFGPRASITADIATRWNSTYKQVLAIVSLGMVRLNGVLEPRNSNLMFTHREWAQLQELLVILSPFSQATDVTQGELKATISYVAPSVVSLYRHCRIHSESAKYLKKLATTLRDSLLKRFQGIFVNLKMANGIGSMPFDQEVYLMSAVLDPKFGLTWVDQHTHSSSDDVDSLKIWLRQQIIAAANEGYGESVNITESEGEAIGMETDEDGPNDSEPEFVIPQLFSYMNKGATSSSTSTGLTAAGQLTLYLDQINGDRCSDSLKWWHDNKQKYCILYKLAKRLLCAPASSSPVERVFSHGGVIMRPHRSAISEAMLSNLIFLKCNKL